MRIESIIKNDAIPTSLRSYEELFSCRLKHRQRLILIVIQAHKIVVKTKTV